MQLPIVMQFLTICSGVHNRIRQDIDDLFYKIENNRGFAVEFDDIDKISESVLNVAIRRF